MLQPTIGNPAAVEDRIEQVVGLDPGRAMLRGHRVGDLLDPLPRQRAAATRAATAVSGLQVSRSGDCAWLRSDPSDRALEDEELRPKVVAALGLAGPPAPKFQTTTDSNHARPTAAEMLDRDFFATRKTERWITDIAYA